MVAVIVVGSAAPGAVTGPRFEEMKSGVGRVDYWWRAWLTVLCPPSEQHAHPGVRPSYEEALLWLVPATPPIRGYFYIRYLKVGSSELTAAHTRRCEMFADVNSRARDTGR
jgi:hypothetical protein